MSYVDEVEVKHQDESNDKMWDAVNTISDQPKFGEGFDEQTFLGLLKALQQAEKHNFIVLFSDEPGNVTDQTIRQEVIDLKEKTKSTIFFLMRPHANTRNNQTLEQSWEDMKRNFDDLGTVINMENHNERETLTEIIQELIKSEVCLDQNDTITTTPEITTSEPATTSITTTTDTPTTTIPVTLPSICHIKVLHIL